MKDHLIIGLLLLGATTLALRTPRADLPQTETNARPASSSASPTRLAANPISPAALSPSLDYLQRTGAAWMHGETEFNVRNGCLSCHVVGFTLWSHRAAERSGVSASASIDDLMAEAMAFVARPGVGRAATWSQLLLARSPRDEGRYDWRSVVDGLVASQESDGRWRARGQFPSQRRGEREADGVVTMWALLALDGVEAREDYVETAAASGLAWLRREPEGRSSEWRAMRLLVERRLGDPDAAEARVARFVATQHEDGGWSWLAEEEGGPSDAYSTGAGLYALRRAGLPPGHPAVAAAVAHLEQTRGDDGAWQVPSRLTSTEESLAGDFVYGYWGTAWAVIGLADAAAKSSGS